MKILQVNCVFRKGSTGKIVDHLHSELKSRGHQSLVCYGRGEKIKEPHVWKIATETEAYLFKILSTFGLVLPYSGMSLATKKIKKIITKEKPDIVHVHCINGNSVNIYGLLKFLAESKIKTLITHHAEFFYTGSCGYSFDCKKWVDGECKACPMPESATGSKTRGRTHDAWMKMKETFAFFDTKNLRFAAVSPWVKNRSELSKVIGRFPCDVVMNGVDTSIFKPYFENRIIENRIANTHGKVVLHVSASFNPLNKEHVKGGWYVVEMAKRLPNITFIVVSTYVGDTGELPPNLVVWGRAASQGELAVLYSFADVTLLTSRRETFSMVCAESQSCGTPVVGFNAGGPESISLPDYSSFVEYGNLDALAKATEQIIGKDFDKQVISSDAHKQYSKEVMFENYMNEYRILLQE